MAEAKVGTIYRYDRYVGHLLMAEGARVTRARSEAQALRVAKRLFGHDSPNSRFVLVERRKSR